jgi:hypothetical protein
MSDALVPSILALLCAALIGCAGEAPASEPPRVEAAWRVVVPAAEEGSLALCDLDGNGVPELLASLSASAAQADATRVQALDAVTGAVLWDGARGEYPYGAPACVQVNGAGAEDVLVTGRGGDVLALDGQDGTEIYRLSERNPDVLEPAASPGFASSVALDRTRSLAATTLAGDRFASQPSRLVLFHPAGDVVAVLDAPDGAESYASPAFSEDADGNPHIAYATGGETVGGHAYIVRFDAPATLSVVAEVASACDTGGFVASPHFADIDGDGVRELVVADYCGAVQSVRRDGDVLWTAPVGGYVSANPVSADLDGDGTLDVVVASTTYNPSVPLDEIPSSVVTGLRGRDGALLFSRELPQAILASPVTADVNDDGAEDVFVLARDFVVGDVYTYQGGLFVLSGRDGSTLARLPEVQTFGTPVGGDVDRDGALDLFFEDQLTSATALASLLRLTLPDVPWDASRAWMGFRGSPVPTGAR